MCVSINSTTRTMEIWPSTVRTIHILIIVAVVIGPFVTTNITLCLYAVIIPFIMLHWYTNNNVCALTTLEKHLRKKPQTASTVAPSETDAAQTSVSECFTCDLIEPVYDVHKNMPSFSSKGIYIGTLLLWVIALVRIQRTYAVGGMSALMAP